MVIGIMAIILAIAVPAYSSWRQTHAAKTAADTLMAHIKQARIMAISDNRSVSIDFTASGYTVDAAIKNLQVSLAQYSNDLSLSNTFSGNTLTFGSQGTAGQGSVTISSTLGSSHTITVNQVGRAYFQ